MDMTPQIGLIPLQIEEVEQSDMSQPPASPPDFCDEAGYTGPKPSAVNAIVKQRAEMAGLEPADYFAHGLRSGYLTEAANRGIPLPEAMEQSRHRSVQQATSYYNNATRRTGKAARLL
jgi:integrase